ncbi:hypothetical protein CEXT_748131 [Caerostris extrusa]|uniref:Uncharacterized protein n=1 Tax=Caerostris extrusa TaxID=172846 RepID=A0AAV4QV40_CAEEX|nr:hypothetical protein CEXT_748131 [Caerostris extrusa]
MLDMRKSRLPSFQTKTKIPSVHLITDRFDKHSYHRINFKGKKKKTFQECFIVNLHLTRTANRLGRREMGAAKKKKKKKVTAACTSLMRCGTHLSHAIPPLILKFGWPIRRIFRGRPPLPSRSREDGGKERKRKWTRHVPTGCLEKCVGVHPLVVIIPQVHPSSGIMRWSHHPDDVGRRLVYHSAAKRFPSDCRLLWLLRAVYPTETVGSWVQHPGGLWNHTRGSL